jgi:hypothetical protein
MNESTTLHDECDLGIGGQAQTIDVTVRPL